MNKEDVIKYIKDMRDPNDILSLIEINLMLSKQIEILYKKKAFKVRNMNCNTINEWSYCKTVVDLILRIHNAYGGLTLAGCSEILTEMQNMEPNSIKCINVSCLDTIIELHYNGEKKLTPELCFEAYQEIKERMKVNIEKYL